MDDQGVQFGGVKFEPIGGERPTDAREVGFGRDKSLRQRQWF